MTPCSSWKSAFLSKVSCLLSSHVPLPFLDTVLKFVEVHHVFLKHELPHDNKLGDSNRLTTWPFSRLFSRVVKYAEEEFVESFPAAKITTFAIP